MKKTFATLVLSFLTVSCGAVAYSDQPINDPIPTDSLEPPVRGTQVTIPEDERGESLGWCHYKGIIIANGSYESGVGEGTTENGFLPCRPFEVAVIDPPTVPMKLPETK